MSKNRRTKRQTSQVLHIVRETHTTYVTSCSHICTIKSHALTLSRVSKLTAGHTGIHSSPSIITYSAPSAVQTNFHTTFIWLSASNQPDTSISASYNVLKCRKLFHPALGIHLSHSQTVFFFAMHDENWEQD